MNAKQVAQKGVEVVEKAAEVAQTVGDAVATAGAIAGTVAELVAPTLVTRVKAAKLTITDRRKRTARVEAGGPT